MLLKLCVLALCVSITIVSAENTVQMPPQIADEEDPCRKRFHVEIGQTCASVAWQNGLKVEELLLLNPGLQCSQFFAEVDLCVDSTATGRVLDEAANTVGYRLLSRQELDENLADSNTPAVQPDAVDTGSGR